MPIKIEFKDLPLATQAQGTDYFAFVTAAGAANLLPLQNLVASGGATASFATGVRLQCADNGYTYEVRMAVQNDVPVLTYTHVPGSGTTTTIYSPDDETTYQLGISIQNGKPVLTYTPTS